MRVHLQAKCIFQHRIQDIIAVGSSSSCPVPRFESQIRCRSPLKPNRKLEFRLRKSLRVSCTAAGSGFASAGNGTDLNPEIPIAGRIQEGRAPLDDIYIWGLIKRQKRTLFIAGLALVVCTGCNLASPVITGILFEILVGKQPLASYPYFLGIMAVMYTVEPLLTRVYIKNVCAAGEEVMASLRKELFRTMLLQKVEFFDQHSAPELTSLISQELDSLRNFVFSNVSRDRGFRAILEASGAVAVLFVLSWRLGPVLAGVIVATAATAALYRKQTKSVERTAAEAMSHMVGVADQAFSAITTVRSFAGEPLERERFGAYVEESFRSGLKFGTAKANLESLNRAAVHLSLLALYGLGGYLVSQSLMPIRVLLSAIGFTFSLVFATQGVVQTFSDSRRVIASLRRVQALVGAAKPDPSMYGALPPGAWWEANANEAPAIALQPYGVNAGLAAVKAAQEGPLELRDVWFSYPLRAKRAVLQGMSLELKRGSVTAMVGRSGAGKSTVAALLSRFYAIDKGGIFLNGRPAKDFTRGEWARAVALVSQEPVLFSGTIADNIAYGRYGRCSQGDVEAAAKSANAHEFIQDLPEGYDTLVGDRGMLLSGGQRQRIAIARALLKDSPIIILDEATSALDVKSEKLVQQAIETLVNGRTVLVIAHRLSTVQAADQIVVLDGGKVAEIGTHEELVAKDGQYADLVNSQRLTLSMSV